MSRFNRGRGQSPDARRSVSARNPPDHVELTCSREPCHVVYAIDRDLLPLLRGATCPDCGRGVLEARESVAPEGCED
jgi:hypothetical protein